jgi:ABC-type branched-subunit amino acid transport system substrate-binding protein
MTLNLVNGGVVVINKAHVAYAQEAGMHLGQPCSSLVLDVPGNDATVFRAIIDINDLAAALGFS